jgi:hypothetical protein
MNRSVPKKNNQSILTVNQASISSPGAVFRAYIIDSQLTEEVFSQAEQVIANPSDDIWCKIYYTLPQHWRKKTVLSISPYENNHTHNYIPFESYEL